MENNSLNDISMVYLAYWVAGWGALYSYDGFGESLFSIMMVCTMGLFIIARYLYNRKPNKDHRDLFTTGFYVVGGFGQAGASATFAYLVYGEMINDTAVGLAFVFGVFLTWRLGKNLPYTS